METILNNLNEVNAANSAEHETKDTTGRALRYFDEHREFPSDRRHVKLGELLKEHFSNDSGVNN